MMTAVALRGNLMGARIFATVSVVVIGACLIGVLRGRQVCLPLFGLRTRFSSV